MSHLNHSAPRLERILEESGAALPAGLAKYLPEPLAPRSPLLLPPEAGLGLSGGLSGEVLRLAGELKDKLRMVLDGATRRALLAAEGLTAPRCSQPLPPLPPIASCSCRRSFAGAFVLDK